MALRETSFLYRQQNGGLCDLRTSHAIDGLVEADEFTVYETNSASRLSKVARQIDLSRQMSLRVGDDGARAANAAPAAVL